MSWAFRRPCAQQLTTVSLGQRLCVPQRGASPALRLVALRPALRGVSTTARLRQAPLINEYTKEVNRRNQEKFDKDVELSIEEVTKNQIRRPWQREGADKPPVDTEAKKLNKSMAKGKLLTTPTRLLKLILPIPADALHDERGNKGEFKARAQNEDIQPLALLVHPQQPLSYLERLIQAELPPIYDDKGREKMPGVYFRAEGSDRDEMGERSDNNREHIATASGLGREGPDVPSDRKDWVRWSSSTEIGDFIRDAARGREFAIDVDGLDTEIKVGVPSFNDRTYYMRIKLRRLSRKVEELAQIKQECDVLAHQGAHRIAQAGFWALATWWGVVYFITFHTEAGWNLVEPVTYLAGLATIMGGYLWFLFVSRDLSYRAAMNVTVTRRQHVLYETRGFDPVKWESLVQDANGLRRDIRIIAEEYDVEYDEAKDLGGDEVKEVLEKEKRKQAKRRDEEDEEDEGKESSSSEKESSKEGEKPST